MSADAAYLAVVLAAYDDPDRRAAVLLAAQTQAERPVKPRPVGIREAARVLGCHPKTVQRYAMQGRLRQIHISPRRVRYDMNEVEKLATQGAE